MPTDSQYKVTIRGVRPLILHSDRGLDTFDPLVTQAKEITSAKKTKDLEENVRRLEWLKYAVSFYGGLKDAPYVPSDNLLKALSESGFDVKKSGKKDVLAGLDILEDELSLEYDGPKTPREMFDFVDDSEDRKFVFKKSVRIPPRTGARVPMSRPRIPTGWTMTFTLVKRHFCALSDSEVQKLVRIAGERVGLCDWRPRYGLFAVEEFKS
jgi:hypothetical protein